MKKMSTHLTIVTPFKEKEFSLTESLSSCIKDVKLNLSRLLNTPVTAIRLELEDDELVDEDTLEQVGCVEDGNTEMKMTIFLPLGDTEVKEFTERQGLPKSDNKKGQAEPETESSAAAAEPETAQSTKAKAEPEAEPENGATATMRSSTFVISAAVLLFAQHYRA